MILDLIPTVFTLCFQLAELNSPILLLVDEIEVAPIGKFGQVMEEPACEEGYRKASDGECREIW